jgi:hypothetical protein
MGKHSQCQLWLCVALSAAALPLAGCTRVHKADLTPLDKAGAWVTDITKLRALNINDNEVQELIAARENGLSEQACLELIRMDHDRKQSFTNGRDAASLVNAGMMEPAILELAQLNELSAYGGEAQAMRLAGLSDDVVMAIAHRRVAGLPTLSGPEAAALKNAGYSNSQVLAEINKGTTDAQAASIVAHHNAAGGHGFVRISGRRRR